MYAIRSYYDVFSRPPVWTDDVVGFALVAIVLLAAAQSLRRGEHIGVDVLVGRLGPRGARWAQAWSAFSVAAPSRSTVKLRSTSGGRSRCCSGEPPMATSSSTVPSYNFV